MRPPSWGIHANQIDAVPIIGVPTFDSRLERWGPTKEATPDRSGMRSGEPPSG